MPGMPVFLETALPVAGSLSLPDTSGTQFDVHIYECSGLTATYTRTLKQVLRSEIMEASWAYERNGGAFSGQAIIQGGLADLDDAVKSEWEIEFLRAGAVWYRGRITDYTHESGKNGEITTRIVVEGYQSKLADIRVNRAYTSQTIKAIVQDILDQDILPVTRITYTASNIVGGYTANSLSFNCDALHALQVLATLQGSTEWGVSEAAAPSLYFVA